MADIIKMNYEAMQEMAAHCKNTSQRLTETAKLAAQLANQMQNGALVGDAGEAFSNALTSAFSPAVGRLAQKFLEIAGDIEGAMADMRTSDGKAGGQF